MPDGVSSSFDFVPFKALDPFRLDPADCSARGMGLAGAGTSRVVIAFLAGRFVLCRTDTADFGDREVRRIVHDRGQLYLDVSGRSSIGDFARDVRQLVVSAACRACPDLPACCAAYVPAERSYFEDDEAWLRDHLVGLAGRLLDVGMGHVPYLQAAEARIRAGEVEYHGLDPDPEAREAASALGLPLVVHAGTIEAFDAPEGTYDHVLSLRSLNHFQDPDRALAVMARVLRPGGDLVLVESLALPLVRTPRHARECHEAGQGGWQHLRNWDSSDVLALLPRHPFEVAYHRPIDPDTCDQWILRLVSRRCRPS